MSDTAAGLKQKEQLAYRPPTEQISRNALEMGRIEGLALHLLSDFIETNYVQTELELGFNSEPPMTILQSLLWAVSWR
jgi:hypothetical protein